MANEVKIDWDTLTAISPITTLNGLTAGNIWQSGEKVHSDPGAIYLRVWYVLEFNITPTANDKIIFRIANTDGGSTPEIWDGGIATTDDQELTTGLVEIRQAMDPVHVHTWDTGHLAVFSGHFDTMLPASGWQLLIETEGENLKATGNTVRYQYGHPQYQA